jgi:hypothetical protein
VAKMLPINLSAKKQFNITKIFKNLGAFFAPQKTGLSGAGPRLRRGCSAPLQSLARQHLRQARGGCDPGVEFCESACSKTEVLEQAHLLA